MKKSVCILVPVKDEKDSLPLLFAELDEVLASVAGNYNFHVVVLDDGSTDNSVVAAKSYASKAYSIGVISFTRNFGKEAAIAAGLSKCQSDAYIIMDSDLQHPPSILPEMLTQWENGYKLVEGVKQDRGQESSVYRIFSGIFYRTLNRMGALDLKDGSDFKLLDNEIAEVIRGLPEKSRFFRGLIDWMGFPSYKIPFRVQNRKSGKSSWNTWKLISYSLLSISSFSSIPLQLVTIIGMATLFLSLSLGSVTLFLFSSGEAVTGFTTVILLLLLIGSMLMISMGLIGLYISRIYEEVKARPAYMIKEEFNVPPFSDENP